MRADGECRSLQGVEVDGNLADRLEGVEMQGDALAEAGVGEGPDGLEDASFVVGQQHGDQAGLGGEARGAAGGVGEETVVDQLACGVDREFVEGVAAGCEGPAGFEHGGVFARGEGDGAGGPLAKAEEGGVVRLGATAGEDHFVGEGPEEAGEGFAGLFEDLAGPSASGVPTAGVGKRVALPAGDGVDNLGQRRRGGVVIEVDHGAEGVSE